MIKSIFLLLILFSNFCFASEISTLSLEQILQMAREKGPQIKAAKLKLESEKKLYLSEKLKYAPTMELKTGYLYEENRFQSDDTPLGTLHISFDLWDSEKFNSIKEKKHQMEFEKFNSQIQQSYIEKDLSLLYFSLLHLKLKEQAYQALIQRTDNQVQMVRKRLQAGKATKSDLLDFELNLTELRSSVLEIKTEEWQIKRHILTHLESEHKDFNVIGELKHFHLDNSKDELFKLLEEAPIFKREESLKQKFISVEKAETGKALPKLALSLEAGYFDPDFAINENEPQWEGLIQAKWDLSVNRLSSAGRRSKNLQSQWQQLNSKMTLDKLKLDLVSQYDYLDLIQKKVDIETQRQIKAKQLYQLVLSEYNRGVKSSGDLQSASKAIFEAQMADANYRLTFLKGLKELEALLNTKLKLSEH